jgi:hypothetical protein
MDVTDRRTPEWIMNWITNTKVMLDKDLAAQADSNLFNTNAESGPD